LIHHFHYGIKIQDLPSATQIVVGRFKALKRGDGISVFASEGDE